MHSYIRPHSYVVLELPSGMLKPVEMVPDSVISIGKYGSFPSNDLLGRPYHLTFEIQDKLAAAACAGLRVVAAAEIQAEALLTEADSLYGGTADAPKDDPTAEADLSRMSNGDDLATMRSNRLTVDDPSRQSLSMNEIEALKKADLTDSGRAIVAKIMASHLALDEKTSFSLAKYALRKERKYLRRFVVRPLDPLSLSRVVLEREAPRILELREETLALMASWSNAFYGGERRQFADLNGLGVVGGGRWLVVDETGGLVVATLAEKMGILYPTEEDGDESSSESEADHSVNASSLPPMAEHAPLSRNDPNAQVEVSTSARKNHIPPSSPLPDEPVRSEDPSKHPATGTHHPRKKPPPPGMSATCNTITVLHTATQPNLGLLKYFSHDTSAVTSDPPHPLHAHLHTVSWLQLLDPSADATYSTPIPSLDGAELATMKSSKRGMYYHKRRRWERVRRVVDLARAGGFDGLIVATSCSTATSTSTVDLADILRHCVPLLRGGAQVVAYCPHSEPLAELVDLYSKERRAAWMQMSTRSPKDEHWGHEQSTVNGMNGLAEDSEDFPVNPTFLLAPTMQTIRAREWQALPGRTHPLMTARGGAEGYVFTATRVLPAIGKVEARGTFTRKRKLDVGRELPSKESDIDI